MQKTKTSGVWQAARELFEAADYQAAAEMIADESPRTSDELLIAGMIRCFSDGKDQEAAKDLITRSITTGNQTQTDRANIFLALCYWRAAEMQEALAYSEAAFNSPLTGKDRFCAALNRAVILRANGQLEESIEILETCAELLDTVSPTLAGKSHNQRAITLRELQRFDLAAREYELAGHRFEEAGNLNLEAVAVNNVAGLLLSLGQYSKAHANVDRAVSLFTRLGDNRLGYALDQRARIEIAEKKYRDAVRSAQAALRALGDGEPDILAEVTITLGVALARNGQVAEAKTHLEAVAKNCEHLGDTARAGQAYAALLEEIPLDYREALHAFLKADEYCGDRKRILKIGVKVAALIEPSFIKSALTEAQGSMTAAAASLGMHRSVLMKRIEDHPELAAFRKPPRVRRWKRKPYPDLSVSTSPLVGKHDKAGKASKHK